MNKDEIQDDETLVKNRLWRGLLFVVCQRAREGFVDLTERGWAEDRPLDPRDAVTITVRELYTRAKRLLEPELIPEADEDVHVPRIPINIDEARVMLAMSMLAEGRMFAGYTNDELAVFPGGAQIAVTIDDGGRVTTTMDLPIPQ
jgi:hypothetical protein